MMIKDVSERNIGIRFKDGRAVITAWSPSAQSLEILLTKNKKRIALHPTEQGYWHTISGEIRPGDSYRLLIDGMKDFPDPVSLYQPGVHEDSIAVDLHPTAIVNSWKNIPLEEYVIYELHTGTFSPSSDFAGIEERIPHLLDLGITAINILPVASFPGERNWGYDGVYPFAVQASYGGYPGLQRLVDACHHHGLAVILDVVYNHLGPEGNYLGQFGPYFTDKYHTPWGKAVNFDDAWCDGVREYFIENALMWLRDFHIDALRLDAIHAIFDFSAVHFLKELRQSVNLLEEKLGIRKYLIAESDLNDNYYINPLSENGCGLEAQWYDDFHHCLHVAVTKESQGYYVDYHGLEDLSKAFRQAFVYDGIYSDFRKKTYGKIAHNDASQFVVFSQNHDQVGNRMLGERLSTLVDERLLKVVAAAVLLSPYIPLLFMGEEWGCTDPFLYFTSHGDEQLNEAVRNGRAEEFKHFQSAAKMPDPSSAETFHRTKPDWNQLNDPKHAGLFEFYKALIGLRKNHPALKPERNLTCSHDAEGRFHLTRSKGAIQLHGLLNFSAQSLNFRIDSGLFMLLDSSSSHKPAKEFSGNIDVPGYSVMIFSNHV